MQRYELLIARRYLFAKRRVRFVNAISLISAIGIMVGVAALLIALSVFNGFSGIVTTVLATFDPHLRIERPGGIDTEEMSTLESLCRRSLDKPAMSPFVSGKAMLVANSFNRVVYVRGVDPEAAAEATGLRDRMLFGEFVRVDSTGVPGIVLGLTLADRLAATVGTTVTVISPYGIGTSLTGLSTPESYVFRVCGIFDSRNKEYDAQYAYIDLAAAQRLYHTAGRFDGLDIRVGSLDRAIDAKQHLAEALPPQYLISTWQDLHRSLYAVMSLEKWAAYLLLSLIVLVASFNMLGSLTMNVLEKRRDIGVLQSMGMTRTGVVRVFLLEGVLIGVIGTVCGIALGLLVLYLQVSYHLFPLDTSIYIIPAIPVEIRLSDTLLIAVSSMGLSCIASYLPARRAAMMKPADAVRWE